MGLDPDCPGRSLHRRRQRRRRRAPGWDDIGLHLCRGNYKGQWMAQGGYEGVAREAVQRTNVDVFFLEYDTPRAGGFEPLRHVPAGKTVILGLISSKTP